MSAAEFQNYYQQFKFKSPKVGKVWQGQDVEPGLYIAIAGKVRLVHDDGDV
ncbi:hypothetical protein [Nodularia spumigena]|uniref:hypothetical protein n=1 Tax=Nodularia spumigena TaxID=70799 RepID=UPI0002E4BD1A|nr:hypothetical protein NSP_5460 [Nodularia spumigena CCY9414]